MEAPWVEPTCFDWIVIEAEADIHVVPDGDNADHCLNGLRCRCTPEIRRADDAMKDTHGYPINYVIMHRPWVWRTSVPAYMPSELA